MRAHAHLLDAAARPHHGVYLVFWRQRSAFPQGLLVPVPRRCGVPRESADTAGYSRTRCPHATGNVAGPYVTGQHFGGLPHELWVLIDQELFLELPGSRYGGRPHVLLRQVPRQRLALRVSDALPEGSHAVFV